MRLYTRSPPALLQEGVSVIYFLNKSECVPVLTSSSICNSLLSVFLYIRSQSGLIWHSLHPTNSPCKAWSFYVLLVLAGKDYFSLHLIASKYSSNVLHTVPLPSFSSLIAFLVVSFGISITPSALRYLTRPLPSFVLSLTVIVYVAISSSFVFRKYSLFILTYLLT